jgi:hypothetical protein
LTVWQVAGTETAEISSISSKGAIWTNWTFHCTCLRSDLGRSGTNRSKLTLQSTLGNHTFLFLSCQSI